MKNILWFLFFNLPIVINASSNDKTHTLVATFTVTNTNASGPGSLSEAVTQANANGISDDIVFNIPGAGPHVIDISTFPDLTEDGTTIDATTQPGWSLGTIVLEGPFFGIGLRLLASDISVIGLHIRDVSLQGIFIDQFTTDITIDQCLIQRVSGQNGTRCAGIVVNSSANTTITNCIIGTDLTGTVDQSGGTFYGIMLTPSSSETTIDGNLISGFTSLPAGFSAGIMVDGTEFNIITNNTIGLNLSQTATIPNTNGIFIRNSDNNTITDNIIGGNTLTGIRLDDSVIPFF